LAGPFDGRVKTARPKGLNMPKSAPGLRKRKSRPILTESDGSKLCRASPLKALARMKRRGPHKAATELKQSKLNRFISQALKLEAPIS